MNLIEHSSSQPKREQGDPWPGVSSYSFSPSRAAAGDEQWLIILSSKTGVTKIFL